MDVALRRVGVRRVAVQGAAERWGGLRDVVWFSGVW